MSGNRKVKIVLGPRSNVDPTQILKDVAEIFPNHNIELNIGEQARGRQVREAKATQQEPVRRDEIAELKIHASAKEALEENATKNEGVIRVPIPIKEVQEKNKSWRKMVAKEGWVVTVKAITQAGIEYAARIFTNPSGF